MTGLRQVGSLLFACKVEQPKARRRFRCGGGMIWLCSDAPKRNQQPSGKSKSAATKVYQQKFGDGGARASETDKAEIRRIICLVVAAGTLLVGRIAHVIWNGRAWPKCSLAKQPSKVLCSARGKRRGGDKWEIPNCVSKQTHTLSWLAFSIKAVRRWHRVRCVGF